MSVSKTSSDSESEASLAPAFLTDAQAAEYLGISPHQLYLYRRGKKPGGPPFIMHGARVPLSGRRPAQVGRIAAAVRHHAQAYAANPQRAKGAARQRATTAQARKAKIEKRAGQPADA